MAEHQRGLPKDDRHDKSMSRAAFPKKELHEALAAELVRLGYKSFGSPRPAAPVVLIDQMRLSPRYVTKDAEDYEITCVLDIVTRSDSPEEAYTIAERIRAELLLEVSGYTVQSMAYEESNTIEEVDDEGELVREVMRCRILVTKKQ